MMRLLIRTVRCERVEGVSNCNNSRQQRNLVAFEAMRIAAAVQRLVMKLDSWNHLFELRDRAQNVGAFRGMRLHGGEFFFGQGSGLFQYPVLNSNLANVMQLR